MHPKHASVNFGYISSLIEHQIRWTQIFVPLTYSAHLLIFLPILVSFCFLEFSVISALQPHRLPSHLGASILIFLHYFTCVCTCLLERLTGFHPTFPILLRFSFKTCIFISMFPSFVPSLCAPFCSFSVFSLFSSATHCKTVQNPAHSFHFFSFGTLISSCANVSCSREIGKTHNAGNLALSGGS